MKQTEWVLPLRDGTVVKIPPAKVAHITKLIEDKAPIRMEGRLILYQDIESGPKEYAPPDLEPELLEGAALAFGSPIVTAHGEIKCVWVKETVSATRWNKYYSQFANYFKLGNSYDSIVVAYRLPMHMLSTISVEKCNESEAQQLEIKLANS